jgi:hypothetical protein
MDIGNHLDKQSRGWLLPYLLALDVIDSPEDNYHGHGRWAYWLRTCERCQVPEGDIPQIHFTARPDEPDKKHVKDVLEFHVQRYGSWYDDSWLLFVRWLLHGFGRRDMEQDVERIPEDTRNFWYEQFNLGILLRSPIDWSAFVIQGGLTRSYKGHRWAKSTGFFSTPMSVVNMMVGMLFSEKDKEENKISSVIDPCVGTGSMLLSASNHSLRLYGCDIVPDLCLCTELNGWLWMPWLVYMPTEMSELFCTLKGETAPEGEAIPSVPTIRLETEPQKIEAVQAYRAGELSQGDFFTTMGIH